MSHYEVYDDEVIYGFVENGITEAQRTAIRKLVASKQTLLQHSIGAEAIETSGVLNLVAFRVKPAIHDADLLDAADQLFMAIVKHGMDARRSPSKEKPAENEKYAFRCFLLRLGFIGDDTKDVRKVLLRNLSGSPAFKAKGGNEHD